MELTEKESAYFANLHCRSCDVPDWNSPLNEDGLCADCAALSADINRMFVVLENNAPAPTSSVPALESERPIPAAIAKLVDIDGFDPLASFADFGKLIELTYRLKIDYHAAITRIYAITTPEIPFSELTVHQIVSAIYAAAEEQSK